MGNVMDPGSSPDSLRVEADPRPVRRFNKIPLLFVLLIVTVFALGIVYVVQQRAAAQREKAEAQEETTGLRPASAGSLLAEAPDGVIPAGVPPRPPAEPSAHESQTGLPVPKSLPQATPTPQQPSPEELAIQREQERIRTARLQALEQALQAPTSVQAAAITRNGYQPAAGLQRSDGQDSAAGTLAQLQARMQALQEGGDPNQQAQKAAFLEREYQTPYLPATRRAPVSHYEIKSGAVIPAVMISGINSDLPGMIVAQVSQHVYDTASGRHLLIPQGTRLVGRYDSGISYGQKRVLVAWHRLVFPDASSLELGNMPGTDGAGYAGFTDKVDNHYFRIFGSAFLMSMIGAAYQLSQPESAGYENDPQSELAAQVGQEMHSTASQMIRKGLDMQPTLQVRPGYRFNVFVTKDIAFRQPY